MSACARLSMVMGGASDTDDVSDGVPAVSARGARSEAPPGCVEGVRAPMRRTCPVACSLARWCPWSVGYAESDAPAGVMGRVFRCHVLVRERAEAALLRR